MKIAEEQIQKDIVTWCDRHDVLCWHTPNGGQRNAREGAKFKRLGVKAGVPDLFIPEFKLFIELKTEIGRLSEAQIKMLNALNDYGYNVSVCRSTFDAVNIIKGYLQKK